MHCPSSSLAPSTSSVGTAPSFSVSQSNSIVTYFQPREKVKHLTQGRRTSPWKGKSESSIQDVLRHCKIQLFRPLKKILFFFFKKLHDPLGYFFTKPVIWAKRLISLSTQNRILDKEANKELEIDLLSTCH